MNNWYKFRLGGLNHHLILKLMELYKEFGEINEENLRNDGFSKDVIDSIMSCMDFDIKEEKTKYEKADVKILSYNSGAVS